MARITVKVDAKTGQNYLPREVRREGFIGEIHGLANAVTITFFKPGASLGSVAESLRILQADIALRRQHEASLTGEGQRPPVKHRAGKPKHPVFAKYTRDWLHEVTGFSKGYLCRVATGKSQVSRSFIERVCYKLQMPEEELFLPEATVEEGE